jgi:hypothetical protein
MLTGLMQPAIAAALGVSLSTVNRAGSAASAYARQKGLAASPTARTRVQPMWQIEIAELSELTSDCELALAIRKVETRRVLRDC